MLEERAYSASLTLNSTYLWITCTGDVNDHGFLQTSEFVSIGKSAVKGPDLPYAVQFHCLVGVNSSTALLCGGENNGGNLNECHYMDGENHSWSPKEGIIVVAYSKVLHIKAEM
jgi:hypothetical protein